VAGRNAQPEITHLFRLRSGVRGVLALGVAASVAANVLHAEPTIVGRAIAAWSPLALLLTVEMISRIPVQRAALSGVRMLWTTVIAAIAAWVSYWHMVSVVARNGESTTSAHLLPLSVDGLVVVASVSLVEIAARLRQNTTTVETPDVEIIAAAVPDPVPVAEPTPAPRSTARRPARSTAKVSAASRIARLRVRHPEWTLGQIAERAGVSERTVRRHLNTPAPALGPDSSTDSGTDAADLAA
jgi:DNA-binding transcriptional ArsR family regulator